MDSIANIPLHGGIPMVRTKIVIRRGSKGVVWTPSILVHNVVRVVIGTVLICGLVVGDYIAQCIW